MDRWLLDKIDRATTKMQRKGYLLTSTHAYVAGITFVSNLAYANMQPTRWFLIPLAGAVWGCYLWGTTKWARENEDYPASARILERLDAEALESRESDGWLRRCFMYLLALTLPGDVLYCFEGDWFKGILGRLSTAAPMLGYYLNGCFFVGPGHFAKEQQELTSQDAVTSANRT